MAVENRIVKVQKRNRALARFDDSRIRRAILRAAESIGGFQQDYLPAINGRLFEACDTDEKISEFLSEARSPYLTTISEPPQCLLPQSRDASDPNNFGKFSS